MKKYRTLGPDETMMVGEVLGRSLRAGDVVCLYGELGSGKTVFVKGVARALGIAERDITSASFTIIAEYRTSPPLAHIDLYRIEKAEELTGIGLRDYMGGDTVAVIEWAERAADELPETRIDVYLERISENEREITIERSDEKDRHHIEERPS